MALGVLPVDSKVAGIVSGQIQHILQQTGTGQVLFYIRVPVQMGHAVVGDQDHICIVQVHSIQDPSDVLVHLSVSLPDHVPAEISLVRVIYPCLGLNASVKDMLDVVDSAYPGEGHVPLLMLKHILCGVAPPVGVHLQLVQVEFWSHPAIHEGPGIVNLHIGTGHGLYLLAQGGGNGIRLGHVDGALVQFEVLPVWGELEDLETEAAVPFIVPSLEVFGNPGT